MATRRPLAAVYDDRTETDAVYVPRVGPSFFPDLRDEPAIDLRRSLVASVMERWDDTNRPHDLPGFPATLAAEADLLDPDQVADGEVMVPGAAFAYETVRQAPRPVTAVRAEYPAPANTGDTVVPEVDGSGGRFAVRYIREDLDEPVAMVDATLDGHPATAEIGNQRGAEQLAAALGTESQEGRILLEIDADIGHGAGNLPVDATYETVNPGDGEPYRIIDATYTLGDEAGSELTYRLLELDEAVYRDAVAAHEPVGDPLTGAPEITR